jgi:hypothetical protein
MKRNGASELEQREPHTMIQGAEAQSTRSFLKEKGHNKQRESRKAARHSQKRKE